MMIGTIVRMRQDRGFGFIKAETGDQYFFHAKQCARTFPFERLEIGQRVTFEPEQGPQGLRAANVDVYSPDAAVDAVNG